MRMRAILFSFLAIIAIFSCVLIFRSDTKPAHAVVSYVGDAVNWGDYVARGLAREGVLARTPKPYNDIGDRRMGGGGQLYRIRSTLDELDDLALAAIIEERGGTLIRDSSFDSDARRGILGGASIEWSTGVVGMGTHLGDVFDMRKESSFLSGNDSIGLQLKSRYALSSHILARGWEYKDEEDRLNTEKLLREAATDEEKFDALPLRDRVRNDYTARAAAAVTWSRIYGVSEGDRLKSALEVSIEKLVRRVPVVIFSRTDCTYAQQALEFFQKLRLSPEPHFIDLDLRPDGINLKALLIRKTGHSTIPNIILGGRSIGGFSDLEALGIEQLGRILESLGVDRHGR